MDKFKSLQKQMTQKVAEKLEATKKDIIDKYEVH